MPSNAFVALGGLASGLGGVLQHKQDQEHADTQKHLDLVNNLVSAGITSGKVSDPEQAFQFLLNGGKKGGKALPPTISTLIQSVMAHNTGDNSGNTDGSTGQPVPPPSGAAALPVPAPAPATATATPPADGSSGSGSGPSDVPTGSESSGSALPTPVPPSSVRPAARSANPMGGFKTTDQLAQEESTRKGADTAAQDMAKYNSQVAVARRMVETGGASSLREAFTMLGIGRQQPIAGLAPKSIALPIPAADVPEGALTTNGDPFAAGSAKFAQKTQVHVGWNADGSPHWEIRYDPSGAPGGTAGGQDPAKMRERIAEIKAANPGLSDAEIRSQAGTSLQKEASTAAALQGTRAQAAGEAAGTLAGPYDDLPTVAPDPTTGKGAPAQQDAFLTQLRTKPKGDILAQNIKQAAQYKMPSSDFTSRQIGGLNRATFVGLVSKFDPTFDEAQYKPRQDMAVDWATGKVATGMSSAKKIINHLEELSKDNAVLDKYSSNVPGLSGIKQGAARVGIGAGAGGMKKAQDAVSAYNTANDLLTKEMQRFFTNVGSGSQKDLDAMMALGSPTATPSDRRAFIRTVGKFMTGQVVPNVEKYQKVMGSTPDGALWLNNRDRLRLRGLGVDTSDLPPLPAAEQKANEDARKQSEAGLPPEIQNLPNGMKATLPDGRIFMRDAEGTLHAGVTKTPAAPKR